MLWHVSMLILLFMGSFPPQEHKLNDGKEDLSSIFVSIVLPYISDTEQMCEEFIGGTRT